MAVAGQPVSVAIDAHSEALQLYKSVISSTSNISLMLFHKAKVLTCLNDLCLRERGFYLLIKNASFSSLPSFGSRVFAVTPLHVHLPRSSTSSLVGRDFHTLIKNVSFSSQPMWDLIIHSPSVSSVSFALVLFSNRCGTPQCVSKAQCPCWHTNREISQSIPSRPSVSLALVPSSNRCGTPQSTLLRLSVLVGTPPCVHPLQNSASLLIHRPVSGSNIICNSLNSPNTDIVLSGISLEIFKTRLLGICFHTVNV